MPFLRFDFVLPSSPCPSPAAAPAVAAAQGQTVSYSAVGFKRFSDGEFNGQLHLDGTEYAQCPDRLHFDVITDTPTSFSQLILLPCTQDLLLQIPTEVTVQFLVINEFEQTFSVSHGIKCFSSKTLTEVTDSLTRATAGSDTAHIVVRGVRQPLIGLVIMIVFNDREAFNRRILAFNFLNCSATTDPGSTRAAKTGLEAERPPIFSGPPFPGFLFSGESSATFPCLSMPGFLSGRGCSDAFSCLSLADFPAVSGYSAAFFCFSLTVFP